MQKSHNFGAVKFMNNNVNIEVNPENQASVVIKSLIKAHVDKHKLSQRATSK